MIYLISLFFVRTYQKYIEINEKNYDETLSANMNNVLLLKIWNMWCQHSKEFAPIWDKYVESKRDVDSGNLIYGDVECQNNPNLCKNLGISTFPQVLWIEPRYDFVKFFNNERTIDNLQAFESKMHFYPFNFVLSRRQIEAMKRNASKFAPLFRVCMRDKENERLAELRNCFIKANIDDEHVYVDNTCEDNNKIILYGVDSNFTLNDKINHKDLENFLKFANLPKIISYSRDIYNLMSSNEENFILMICDGVRKCENLGKLADSLNSPYRFILCNYSDIANADLVDVRRSDLPFIALYNPTEKKYFKYPNEVKVSEISNWLHEIEVHHVEWIYYNGSLLSRVVKSKLLYAIVCVPSIIYIVYRSRYHGRSGTTSKTKEN